MIVVVVVVVVIWKLVIAIEKLSIRGQRLQSTDFYRIDGLLLNARILRTRAFFVGIS
jgi:hypothetical protein